MAATKDENSEEVMYILSKYPYVFYTKATDTFYMKKDFALKDDIKDIKLINKIYKRILDKNRIYKEVNQYDEPIMEIFRKLFDTSPLFRKIIFEYQDASYKD